jgi:hypothetical protein
VRDPNRISRGETILELTVAVAGLALWVQLDAFHRVFHFFGLTITLSALWPYFFWALAALSLAGIALSCLNLSNDPRFRRLTKQCFGDLILGLGRRSERSGSGSPSDSN